MWKQSVNIRDEFHFTEDHAKLTWRSASVTYFALDPLRSYFDEPQKTEIYFLNIYIFIAIALDETSILVSVIFSMQNIYQSCDLGYALGCSNVDVSQ